MPAGRTETTLRDTPAINVRGVWLRLKHGAAAMAGHSSGGGAAVNCSSWLAHGALPGSTIYFGQQGRARRRLRHPRAPAVGHAR